MIEYEVAIWDSANESPSRIRFGMPRTENHAAHDAVRLSKEMKHHMCVVEANTDKVVQIVRWYS